MTKPITDGTTGVAESLANKFMYGDGYTGGIYATVSYRIAYAAGVWGVTSNYGTKISYAAVAPVWNAGDNRLDITLTLTNAFTGIPTAQATAEAGAAHASGLRFHPQVTVTSATTVVVRFIDLASTANYQTAESTKMAFYLTLTGCIA